MGRILRRRLKRGRENPNSGKQCTFKKKFKASKESGCSSRELIQEYRDASAKEEDYLSKVEILTFGGRRDDTLPRGKGKNLH